ncbi:hypothetical protein KL951_003835 [Ogataea haglerorum]|nr:hypothetical protein KL951_003835 [Ogataea haglerorum]
MNTLRSIRSASQTRSNRSGSRSFLGSGRSSTSTSRSGSRSRPASNMGSLNARESVDNYSFTGLQAPEKNMAFDGPKEHNIEKELEKTFWRKFRENVVDNDNAWIKLFLFASSISAIVILALECTICALFFSSFRLIESNNDDFNPILAIYGYYRSYLKQKRYAMGAYLALYIYAELYQILTTFIILYTRNVYHLASSILFLAAMAIYAGIQYNEINMTITSFATYSQLFTSTFDAFGSGTAAAKVHIKNLSIAVIILACSVCVIQLAIGLKLKDKFQKFTGEAIGNSRKMIYANTVFNLHRDALLLALFFAPGYFLQAVIIAPNKSDAEFRLTLAALVLSVFVIFGADYSTSREKKITSAFFSLCCTVGLGFIIFKIVRLYLRYHSASQGIPGRQSVVAFGVITTAILLCLMVLLLQVIRNFGLGLFEIYAGNYNWLRPAHGGSRTNNETGYSKATLTGENQINEAPNDIDMSGELSPYLRLSTMPKREELEF